MDKVKDLSKVRMPAGKVLVKVVEKKSIVITTAKDDNMSNFSHYVIINANEVDWLKDGDIVVAAEGINNQGGFEISGEIYMVINNFNITAVTNKENFKL